MHFSMNLGHSKLHVSDDKRGLCTIFTIDPHREDASKQIYYPPLPHLFTKHGRKTVKIEEYTGAASLHSWWLHQHDRAGHDISNFLAATGGAKS